MRTIEDFISPFIESQFPAFYQEEGPLFILFAKEYFRWLETNESNSGKSTYYSRNLLEYRDIDTTIDDFLIYFKNKYLNGVDFNTLTDKRRLVKAAQDLYKSKGTSQSIDLLFKIVYGINIEVYTPGDDILRPSDGKWILPTYLELSRSSRSVGFVGKTITGSFSGASGFVEYIITRNINGKLIDVMFLSNTDGTFSTGDIITENGIIQDAPKVIGSLSRIDITAGGSGFSVGEEVKIISNSGVEGLATVTGVEDQTGVVSFTLVNGGWGYSNTATTDVSSKVILFNNFNNSNTSILQFNKYDLLNQNLHSLTLNNITGSFINGELLEVASGNTGVIVSVSQAAGSNAGTVIVNPASGNVLANNKVYAANQAWVSTNTNILFNVGEPVRQSNGSSLVSTAVINSVAVTTVLTINSTPTISSNGIHVGQYIEQPSSGANGYIIAVDRESQFGYTNVTSIVIGSVSGTFVGNSTINVYPDNSNLTFLASATPNNSTLAYTYKLTGLTGNRWSSNSSIVRALSTSTNTTVLVSSDVGGVVSACTDVSSTGEVIGVNSSAVGIISITNNFYGNGRTKIYSTSNSTANSVSISTGTGADFNIGILENAETVLLSPDLISGNNDGPGTNSVNFSTMLITGANSGYGNLATVAIIAGGAGYDNTNVIVFSGGNTGVGSYTPGNASIVTNSSGTIVDIGLSANLGNLIVSTPSLSVVNSSGGSTGVGTGGELIPGFNYGFTKQPFGTIDTPLLNLFSFETKNIGSIATITNINPGENYNLDPFVNVYEPLVASYGKKDYILGISNTVGNFVIGESVAQIVNSSGLQITSNTYSGNTSNQYEIGEAVFSTDGISNVATGIIYSQSIATPNYTLVLKDTSGSFVNTISASILTVSTNTGFSSNSLITQGTANGILVTSNSTTLVVKNVVGTFAANATNITSNTGGSASVTVANNTSKIYKLTGVTSNSTTEVTNASPFAVSLLARGVIKSSNSSVMLVSRRSLFNEFTVTSGNDLLGQSSGATAAIISVSPDNTSNTIGDNAIISANVVTSTGSIVGVNVVDSGLGYINDEIVTLNSLDGLRSASGKTTLGKNGVGKGYYGDNNSLLDDTKFIIDGEYYQEYSYEVQSNLPFETYEQLLREVVHVSGTKMFGRIKTSTTSNNLISVASSSIEIT